MRTIHWGVSTEDMGYAWGKVLERFEGHEILFTEIAQKVGEKKPKIGNSFEWISGINQIDWKSPGGVSITSLGLGRVTDIDGFLKRCKKVKGT